MKINEEEFRTFIADIDNYIEGKDFTLMRIKLAIIKYKAVLDNIDPHSSDKFKQLKFNYGDTSK